MEDRINAVTLQVKLVIYLLIGKESHDVILK
jgi:hypothetical protein